MRKLFFALAALPLVLTGCLKSDGYTSKLAPVAPGVSIYNFVKDQNDMAMQPAEVGIRLAMLLAEAEKQGSMNDPNGVTVDGTRVKDMLFGRTTTVEKTADGYKITYDNSHGDNDQYLRKGVFRVATNGAEQLSQTEVVGAKKWVVTVEGDLVVGSSSWQYAYFISNGSTMLYNAGNGVYRFDISGFEACKSASKELKSKWYGGFDWKPADAGLAYTACVGKESWLSGEASGESFYSLNNSTPANMWYKLADGRMYRSGNTVIGGTEEGGLSSTTDYDTSTYPSPNVKVEWSYDDKKGLSYVFTWNGISVSMP